MAIFKCPNPNRVIGYLKGFQLHLNSRPKDTRTSLSAVSVKTNL